MMAAAVLLSDDETELPLAFNLILLLSRMKNKFRISYLHGNHRFSAVPFDTGPVEEFSTENHLLGLASPLLFQISCPFSLLERNLGCSMNLKMIGKYKDSFSVDFISAGSWKISKSRDFHVSLSFLVSGEFRNIFYGIFLNFPILDEKMSNENFHLHPIYLFVLHYKQNLRKKN